MPISELKSLSALAKAKALDLGFDLCGIAPSYSLKEHEPIIRDWCSSGMNGDMHYLLRNLDKRINPELLFPKVRSVIVTGLNYFPERKQGGEGIPVISRYAYGIDYHEVIKGKLEKLLEYIKTICPESAGKSYVDSAPVLEKAWAKAAGLGWPGRHSVLINNKIGSFFFLGVILLNKDMDYDEPFAEDLCGTCRLCIDSCPTDAINENRTIDARKCISYLTIESKRTIPEDILPKMEGRIFGCDRCQEVCPWNKNALPHKTPEFALSEELEKMSLENWLSLKSEKFIALFKKSAIGRHKYDQFVKNVAVIVRSSK